MAKPSILDVYATDIVRFLNQNHSHRDVLRWLAAKGVKVDASTFSRWKRKNWNRPVQEKVEALREAGSVTLAEILRDFDGVYRETMKLQGADKLKVKFLALEEALKLYGAYEAVREESPLKKNLREQLAHMLKVAGEEYDAKA